MANSQKDGIMGLPDEILTIIFTIVETDAGGDYPYDLMLSLASICRRFRDVIFNHANFWNNITNVLDPNLAKLALTRSKGAGLEVIFYGVSEDFTEDNATILEIIGTQAQRITSLTFFFLTSNGNKRNGTWRSITDLLTTFENANFLRLEEMKLVPPPPDSDDEDEEEEDKLAQDDDLYHIYTQWSAPSLKRLCLIELVPRLADGLRLTSLELTFDTSWHATEDPLTKIMLFLKSQPSLERLRVDMGQLEEPTYQWEETIDLPQLQYLSVLTSVDNDSADSAVFSIPKAMSCLSVPAVETIEVNLPIMDRHFTMESCFPRHREYPRVRSLDFALFHHEDFDLDISPFKTIFAKFPRLTDMTIHFAHSTVSGCVPDISMHPPPPLERISFFECLYFDMEEVLKVVRYLSKSTHWSELKEFKAEISPIGTPTQMRELATLIPPERMDIIPYVED